MTESNAAGWLACAWQDCSRSRLYHENPALYASLAPYASAPEIFISLSPDNSGASVSSGMDLYRLESGGETLAKNCLFGSNVS